MKESKTTGIKENREDKRVQYIWILKILFTILSCHRFIIKERCLKIGKQMTYLY